MMGTSDSPDRTCVLFIGGSGRSGSTLLERLLGRLDGVTALGEVTHLWERGVGDNQLCGCGQPFRACPFWTRVGMSAFNGWENVDPERMLALRERVDKARHIPRLLRPPRGDFGRDLVEYTDMFARTYRAAAAASGGRWLVDSSKHVSQPFALRHHPSLDVRVVHLVRDPRGVAHSWHKAVRRPEIVDRYEEMPQFSTSAVIRNWYVHNAGFEALPRAEVPRLTVRYEDLVADPAATITRIAGLIDNPVPPDLLQQLGEGVVELGVDHTAAGNPMRFRTGPITLRQDVEWRTQLPATQRRHVSAATAPLLVRYGYPVRHAGGTVR